MKRYICSAIIQPSYHVGDVVYEGNALSYQATSEIQGDINNFPESFADFVRNIYYMGDAIYKVEWLTDEDHLFKENYQRFYNKVNRVLEDSGFTVLEY